MQTLVAILNKRHNSKPNTIPSQRSLSDIPEDIAYFTTTASSIITG